jgi:hypothetical protein
MKTIEVSEEVFEKIKDQLGESVDVSSLDDFVGQKLFIRTVTYHLLGEVVKRAGNLLELKDASWVADSGRFMNAIKEGTLNEVEPVGKCWVNSQGIIDIFPWAHPLPKEQV